MRFTTRILLSLLSLAATFASAQTIPAGTFKHIIIVVQENRTPDNLFGANPTISTRCGSEDPFEPGIDIENGGYAYVPQPNGPPQLQLICNTSLPLSSWDANLPRQTKAMVVDPGHFYADWGKDLRLRQLGRLLP